MSFENQFHASFYDPVLNVVPTSQVRVSTMLILLILWNAREWDGFQWHNVRTKFHDIEREDTCII